MKADEIIQLKIELETRLAILTAALDMAAEFPAAFECLEQGLKAIQEVRPGWPSKKEAGGDAK